MRSICSSVESRTASGSSGSSTPTTVRVGVSSIWPSVGVERKGFASVSAPSPRHRWSMTSAERGGRPRRFKVGHAPVGIGTNSRSFDARRANSPVTVSRGLGSCIAPPGVAAVGVATAPSGAGALGVAGRGGQTVSRGQGNPADQFGLRVFRSVPTGVRRYPRSYRGVMGYAAKLVGACASSHALRNGRSIEFRGQL